MDRARSLTDKKLVKLEHSIDNVYATDPELKAISDRYSKYMKTVQKRTEESYSAYHRETDEEVKAELKKTYMKELRSLTMDSKEYNAIVRKFVAVLAKVNQKALDLVNAEMPEIYAMNYNQVATECRRVGIKVNE